MDYKNLFIDSDILLDLLFERSPFYEFSEVLLAECIKRKIGLNTSALVIANIQYIASKKLGLSNTKNRLKDLIKIINVLPFDINAINFSIKSDFTDFEDAIQHFIAVKNNCDAIITRNIKDYKYATIPVLTAEGFFEEDTIMLLIT